MPQRRVRLMFVDRRYRFPSVSQAELAEAEGDEGLSAYRISAEGFWKDARAGEEAGEEPQILGSCQSRGSLNCDQYHQAPLHPRHEARLGLFGSRK